MTRTRQNMRWWVLRIGVLLISTAFTLALAEGMASYWLYRLASDDQFRHYGTLEQSRKRFDADGKTDMRFAPHRYLGYVLSPGYRRGENYHNRQGYRGDPFPIPKPKNEFRIFCLGGSTTYTTEVDRPSKAYPAVMERYLHERGYDHVRVINAGVDGWSTFETLINFQFRVLDLQPDMIVAYQGCNDAYSRLVLPPTAYLGDNSGTRQDVIPFSERLPLIERSTIVRMLLTQFGDRKSPLELTNVFDTILPTAVHWQYLSQLRRDTYPEGIFETRPIESIFETNPPIYFRRNLENLIGAATREGVVSVLATFAMSPNYSANLDGTLMQIVDHPPYAAAIDEHNEIVRDLGKRDDIHVFDFAAIFPRKKEFYVDPAHVNEAGAEAKGEMFAEYLLSEGLIPQRP